MIKILDWAMPHLKKSRMLVKLSEKFWNLTRQDIQMPYIQRMMNQYMMEHYEIKNGFYDGKGSMFEYYHRIAANMENDGHKRIFENALFSADFIVMPQNYTIMERNPGKIRAIGCGVFLNLIRSGMCDERDMKAEISNKIVDQLYNIYMSVEKITPRVDVSPDQQVLKW